MIYNYLVTCACDIGMIFLDYRFTIPNFPSRLLSYMQAKIPVLAVTDSSTDVGKVIVQGGFGWWCESNNKENFRNAIDHILSSTTNTIGVKGYKHLTTEYSTSTSYEIVINHFRE